jgi:hypothetical protein
MSGKRGSNSRPSAWEADALPTELLPLKSDYLIIRSVIIHGSTHHPSTEMKNKAGVSRCQIKECIPKNQNLLHRDFCRRGRHDMHLLILNKKNHGINGLSLRNVQDDLTGPLKRAHNQRAHDVPVPEM